MADSFQQAEEEFFRLRGQFAVGNITAEEFDAALQQLQVRDDEGRVWMLGANTGRWYYSSSEWVEGEPPLAEAVDDETLLAPSGLVPNAVNDVPFDHAEDFAQAIDMPLPLERARLLPNRLVLALFGISIVLLLFGAFVLGLLDGENPIFASADASPMPTRIVPRVAVNNSAEVIPPTATATRYVQVTPFGTPFPMTPTPALVIEPTSTEPVLTVIPTITPNRNPGRTTESNSSLPPAVYVTNIRVSPNPPPRQGEVTFTASFWNTNRESVPMNWRIILLDPEKARNKDFGESPFAGITVPPGRTEYSITYTPVNNGGPCLTLQALAARRQDDNSRVYLNGTSGSPYATFVTFC
jgi:hypothetical protein